MKIENSGWLPKGYRNYKIKVGESDNELMMETWCCDHLIVGTWCQAFAPMGNSRAYLFDSEADAMLFLLKWTK